MTTGTLIFIGLIQAVLIALAAPLFSCFSRVLRAKMHSRHGPPLLQNYYDLIKLTKRQEVLPAEGRLVFLITPYLVVVAMLLAAMVIPILVSQSPFGWVGDVILVIYLFALVRFFTSLSGMASGSPFAGIGSRRELIMSALVEPLMLLVLFVMALLAGSTSLGVISTSIVSGALPYAATVWLGMIAFAFVVFIEMGKIPFDVGEAEHGGIDNAVEPYLQLGKAPARPAAADGQRNFSQERLEPGEESRLDAKARGKMKSIARAAQCNESRFATDELHGIAERAGQHGIQVEACGDGPRDFKQVLPLLRLIISPRLHLVSPGMIIARSEAELNRVLALMNL